MTAPDFVFNEKTGELCRGGKLLPLCKLHADMFACLAKAQGPISAAQMERACGLPPNNVRPEMPAFRARLAKVSIRIAAKPGRNGHGGYWLVFDDMPKWAPTIPPPAEIPFQ